MFDAFCCRATTITGLVELLRPDLWTLGRWGHSCRNPLMSQPVEFVHTTRLRDLSSCTGIFSLERKKTIKTLPKGHDQYGYHKPHHRPAIHPRLHHRASSIAIRIMPRARGTRAGPIRKAEKHLSRSISCSSGCCVD